MDSIFDTHQKKMFNIDNLTYLIYNDNVWFKGKDIATMLGYNNSKEALKRHVAKHFKITIDEINHKTKSSTGGVKHAPYRPNNNGTLTSSANYNNNQSFSHISSNINGSTGAAFHLPYRPTKIICSRKGQFKDGQIIYINEAGLYALALHSKLPTAIEFQRWICEEVLPSIRKTGSYNLQKKDVKMLPDLNDYENKNCFYLLHVNQNKYKFGISQCIKDRINTHKRELNFDSVVKIWNINDYTHLRKLEKQVKDLIKYWNISYAEDGQIEWFQLNEDISINDIVEKINGYIQTIQESNIENIELRILQEKTKQMETELKHKETELQSNKINVVSKLLELYRGPNLESLIYCVLTTNFKPETNVFHAHAEIQQPPLAEAHQEINPVVENTQEISPEVESVQEVDILEQHEHETTPETHIVNVVSQKNNKNCVDCNKSIFHTSIRCGECATKEKFMKGLKDRPSYEELKYELSISNFVQVGKKYGVSDNTIRKWLKKYEKYGLVN